MNLDPDLAYRRMTDAYRDRDWIATLDAARDLRGWNSAGGSPPEGHSRSTIVELISALAFDAMAQQKTERRRARA